MPPDAGDYLLDRFPHECRRMAEQIDAVSHAVVQVRVAVEVADRRALRLGDHELLARPESGIARLAARDVKSDLGEGCTRSGPVEVRRGHVGSLARTPRGKKRVPKSGEISESGMEPWLAVQ